MGERNRAAGNVGRDTLTAMFFGDRTMAVGCGYAAGMTNRRFPRYRVDRPLRAMVEPRTPSSLPLRGRCLVLGEGGLDAILPEHLMPGKTVYVESAPALKVCAAVRNRRSFHYGLEFIQVNEAERVAIKQLCESYPPSRRF